MLAPVLKPADIPVETEVKHALWSVPVFADNNLTEHPALDEDAFPFAVYEDDHVTVRLYRTRRRSDSRELRLLSFSIERSNWPNETP